MSMTENNTRDGVLSPVSSADSKISTTSRDSRVFERLSVSSVQHFIESLGYETHYRKLFTIISADALCALTEDVNYRLRELANKAALFMRQTRRDKLTVGDVNEALKWSGASVLFGHRSREPPRIHFLKDHNIFVPNDGVVDATTLALANSKSMTTSRPVLTGYLVPGLFGQALNEPTSSNQVEFRSSCVRLLRMCLSCPLEELNKYLAAVGQASSSNPHTALMLLNILTAWSKKTPTNPRIWYCIRQIIQKSDFSRCADGLNLLCRFCDQLTDTILHHSSGQEFPSYLLSTITTKYNFLSISHFDQALLGKLDGINLLSPSHACRILTALLSMVDSRLILSRIDLVIDQFKYYMNSDEADSDLAYVWKRFIGSLLGFCIGQVQQKPTLVDNVIWNLYQLAVEEFGDGLVLPLIFDDAFEYLESKMEQEKSTDQVQHGSQFLEEHWNSITEKIEDFADSEKREEPAEIKLATQKKRKRRREASDVFSYPKRFRLMHQRDIIFVFHTTQATVRPLSTCKDTASIREKSEGNWKVGTNMNQIWTRIRKRNKKLGEERPRVLPMPVDVRTVVI